MLPTMDEAIKELHIAGELNPGPWVKHSENVGLAAKNIAHLVPELDENKAYMGYEQVGFYRNDEDNYEEYFFLKRV